MQGPTAESSIELQELASLSQNESTENDEVSPSPPNASSNDEQTTIEHDTRRTENEALPSDGPSAPATQSLFGPRHPRRDSAAPRPFPVARSWGIVNPIETGEPSNWWIKEQQKKREDAVKNAIQKSRAGWKSKLKQKRDDAVEDAIRNLEEPELLHLHSKKKAYYRISEAVPGLLGPIEYPRMLARILDQGLYINPEVYQDDSGNDLVDKSKLPYVDQALLYVLYIISKPSAEQSEEEADIIEGFYVKDSYLHVFEDGKWPTAPVVGRLNRLDYMERLDRTSRAIAPEPRSLSGGRNVNSRDSSVRFNNKSHMYYSTRSQQQQEESNQRLTHIRQPTPVQQPASVQQPTPVQQPTLAHQGGVGQQECCAKRWLHWCCVPGW